MSLDWFQGKVPVLGVRGPYFIIDIIIIITLFYVGFYSFLAFPLRSANLHRGAPVLASLVLLFEPTLCATIQRRGSLFRGSVIRGPCYRGPCFRGPSFRSPSPGFRLCLKYGIVEYGEYGMFIYI